MTKPHIRIVIVSLGVGGTERHLLQVLPKLKERGWNISLLALSAAHLELKSAFENQGIEVKVPHYPHDGIARSKITHMVIRFSQLLRALAFLYKEFRKDPSPNTITHFFLPAAYAMGMVASTLARVKGPRIMSRRSLNYYQHKYPGFNLLETFLHQRTNLVLGNSKAILDQLHIEESVPNNKLQCIYNGFDLEQVPKHNYRAETREALSIGDDALILIIVANLIPYKGHRDLLTALHIALPNLPEDWHLLCVGSDNGIGHSLQEQAEICGLTPHVHWLGLRSDVPSLCHAADIGLLCSHEEGFSNAIIENMACGLPVIATDVGGNKEAVLDNETGFIVPPKTPQKLADAISKLANDKELRQRFGEAGKTRVEQHFSLEACVEGYEGVYQNLGDRYLST